MTTIGSETIDMDLLWDYTDPPGSEVRFRELLGQITSTGTDDQIAELLTQLARSQGLQRHFDEANATLDRAQATLANDKSRARIRLLLERGRVLNSSGSPEESKPFFVEALDLATTLGEDGLAVDAAHMMGIVEPPEKQLAWNVRAIGMAEASYQPSGRKWLGSLYNNTGWSYHGLGQYDQALDFFQRGLQLRRASGEEKPRRIAAWTVARCLRSMGKTEEALELQRQNLKDAADAGDSDGFIQEELGECLLALGRPDEARPYFAQAHQQLSQDVWLQANEPERLARLRGLGSPI